MDFHQTDIRRFLQDYIPTRFGPLSRETFSDFVQYLFELDGYDLHPGPSSGELMHVFLAQKDGVNCIVLPLKYIVDTLVTDKEIRQISEAARLYDNGHAWIVTTSTIADQAVQLADELDVELWDWDALYAALCQMFFEGRTHDAWLADHPIQIVTSDEDIPFKMSAKWQAVEGTASGWYNLGLAITNTTERNIYLHLELPALIDQHRQQHMAEQWVEGEFVSGMVYAGASVRTNVLFAIARVGDRPPGGKVVVTCHERRDLPVTWHLSAKLKGEACFVVTYCYSRQSHEYREMIRFRDEVLATSWPGRALIHIYYLLSPGIVCLAKHNNWADRQVRRATETILPWCRRRLNPK